MQFVMESYTEEERYHQDTVNDYYDIRHRVTSETCQWRQVTIFTIGLAMQVVSDVRQISE
jgi:hypothetical protein